MNIGKEYKLSHDSLNVIISKKMKHKKTGKTYYQNKWYYPTFETALMGLVDRGLLDGLEGSELRLIVSRIEELKENILAALKTMPENLSVNTERSFIKKQGKDTG